MWHSKRIFVEFPSLSFSYLFAGDSALYRLILKTFSSHYQRAAASSLWCWRARLCDRWVVKSCGTKAVKHGFSPHFTRKSVWIRDSDGIFGPLVHLINSDFIYPKGLKGNPEKHQTPKRDWEQGEHEKLPSLVDWTLCLSDILLPCKKGKVGV